MVLTLLTTLHPAPGAGQIVDSAATARALAPLRVEATRVSRWVEGISLARQTLAYREGLDFEFMLEELRLHLAQLDTAARSLTSAPRLVHLMAARDLAERVSLDLVAVADGFRACGTCAAPSRKALTAIADSAGASARRWWRLTPYLEAELSAAVARADRLDAPPQPSRRP